MNETNNKALLERLKKAEMAVAILRDALKKRDRCEDCGGKGFSCVEIEGEAEPDPCECSRWADLVIESTATIDGITKIGEGWIPPCEASALRERAEAAQASFKERDLQMRAALEETESMFQRTQRAEAIIVGLHQLVGEKLTANPANIQAAVERLIQAKEKAEAACAEKDECINGAGPFCTCSSEWLRKRDHALSSNCGQTILDKLKSLETEKAEFTALLSLARTLNKKRRQDMKVMEELQTKLIEAAQCHEHPDGINECWICELINKLSKAKSKP